MSLQQTPLSNPTPKGQLKAMRIFCIALVTGVVLFAIIVTALLQSFKEPLIKVAELPDRNLFLYVAAGLGLLGLVMAFRIYSRKLPVIQNSGQKLTDKMSAYQRLLIIFLALCEGPALFSVIVLFLTSRYEVLGITVVLVAAMVSKLPTRSKLVTLLQADMNEAQQFD
ncbi:MAG: hypothetical protein JNM88_08530 [Chitinophagaceae bacterium]|nr:hypothetical protein [Chitinophagaceae bacterium]